ncbi:MAG: hypothetical protein AMS27_00975 [Bacteroides sp. SM23_62_1]|nr:MAG: hypothetical protein AMS27_00975 [Bacteroides sp. SM23_62_1]
METGLDKFILLCYYCRLTTGSNYPRLTIQPSLKFWLASGFDNHHHPMLSAGWQPAELIQSLSGLVFFLASLTQHFVAGYS